MCCEADTATTLRRCRLNVTPQRLLIISTLRHSAGHVSVQQVLHEVQREYTYLDASTVYRTFDMLARRQLATVTYAGEGQPLYEWDTGVLHHHLLCSLCGDSEEIHDDLALGLTVQLKGSHGFTATPRHLTLPGICRACAASTTAGEIGAPGTPTSTSKRRPT